MKPLLAVFREQRTPLSWLLILVTMSSCYTYKPIPSNKDEIRYTIGKLQKGDELKGRLENGNKFEGKFYFSDSKNIYLGNGGVSKASIPIGQIAQLKLGKETPVLKYIFVVVVLGVTLLLFRALLEATYHWE